MVRTVIPAERFDEVVSRCLVPTMEQRGLRRVSSATYEARFEGLGLVVVIGLDVSRTSELHAWVGSPDDDAGMVSVDALDPPFATSVASDERELADVLDRFAVFLTTKHPGFFSEGPLAFVDVVDRLRESANDYTRRVMNAPILDRADDAWRRHDFAMVVELLASIRGSLDQTHLRRLEYALAKGDQGHG